MKKVLLILFGLVALTGCQSLDFMSIDYLLPAEMSFPTQLRKVAVVNCVPNTVENTLAGQFTDKPDVNSRMQYQKTEYLLGDGKVMAEALAQTLADGDYFDQVIICDSALRADNTEQLPTLSQAEADSLMQDLGADFLIAVENVLMRVESKAAPDAYFGMFAASTDVKVAPTVRIYIPHQNPRAAINKVDSIFWQGFGEEINEAIHALPNQRQVANEASQHAGEFIAHTFVPYWESANRYYFTNGSVAMRDAVVFMKEDNWEEAIRLWESAFNDTMSAKKKMYAAYNLALGNEMTENIEGAIDWVTKAQQYANQANQGEIAQLASIYLQQLQQRKQSFANVKMQMQRFDEDF